MIRTTWKLKAGVKLPFAPERLLDNASARIAQSHEALGHAVQMPDTHSVAQNDQIKPMRQESCDLYIESSPDIAYLEALCSFLNGKGISIGTFNEAYDYKDSDIVLGVKERTYLKCQYCVMTADKALLWAFLKQVFADRL